MSNLPRLAIGAIQADSDAQPILWGLLDALEESGVRTQTFLSRACFRPHDASASISGRTTRHLDSWLMTSEVCRQAFLRVASTSDLAVVEGRYDQTEPTATVGGSLDTLCNWLDLPRIAVVDVRPLTCCRLPPRPSSDRLFLDSVVDQSDFCRWQTILESLWGIPVIGGLSCCTPLRQNIAALPPNQKPDRQWCKTLGQEFRKYSNLPAIMQLASRRGIASDQAAGDTSECRTVPRGNVRVAVAYDDAFNCYFPDTLDMLELRGASVRVFSPLRDECLPPDTDIVYLGCGAPHEHAQALSENHCLHNALKEHVCSGRRIYAEGGGLAYLCQQIESADGQRMPMVGALRAIARRNPVRCVPQPVEVTLAVDSWLGSMGTKLRGYRNSNWLLEPTGCITRFAQEADSQLDLVGRHQAIGSRIHLNFAAQPNLLGGFLRPCPEALAWNAK